MRHTAQVRSEGVANRGKSFNRRGDNWDWEEDGWLPLDVRRAGRGYSRWWKSGYVEKPGDMLFTGFDGVGQDRSSTTRSAFGTLFSCSREVRRSPSALAAATVGSLRGRPSRSARGHTGISLALLFANLRCLTASPHGLVE